MIAANCIGFTQDYNPTSPRQDWLYERLMIDAQLKIGWLSQQKDTLKSIKSLANLALDATEGAVKAFDLKGARTHLTEYVNNSTILKYGKQAFTIINDNHQVVYKMIKNECDENDVLIMDWNYVWETDEMKLLVNSTRLATNKELLMQGLFEGPLMWNNITLNQNFAKQLTEAYPSTFPTPQANIPPHILVQHQLFSNPQ